MILKDALKKFEVEGAISILVDVDGEPTALSEANIAGGLCECCSEICDTDNLEVIKVVNIESMQVVYEREVK